MASFSERTAILVDGGFYRLQAKKLFGDKTPEERADELFWVKGQNVCLARRVAGVRFGLFECRLSGCSRCR